MKLRKGRFRYRMPPHSWIESVVLDDRHHGVAVSLSVTAFEREFRKRLGQPKRPLGRPENWVAHGRFIEFDPPPDRAYEVKIRYAPPLVEI